MKKALVCLIFISIGYYALSQNNPGQLPPGYLEQMKKNLPPGAQLPPEMLKMIEQQEQSQQGMSGSSGKVPQPLVTIPPVQEYSYNPMPSTPYNYSPFGSGRNEAQRKAALIAVETALAKMPLLLPLPEYTPPREYMLMMAEVNHKLAKQKFLPDDLTNYSRMVTWQPRFDGKAKDTIKAAQYSMAVALSTNNNPYPYFNIALACAIFALDPDNSVQANNLASAIISGGELICEKNPNKEALAPFRRDAETAFLYAISHSMNGDEWSERSLIPVINLGNLCIDLGRLEEARSLFMVARKIKPESWDAALGLAAYFIALNQKDKALAILEDENLDLPAKYLIPVKAGKSLEKSEPFSDLPPESPAEKYEQGIQIMAQEPVNTSADFIAQLDQSERNKMRYFIEHLPVKGSFKAPSISKLTQYSTLKAISSPQGISALNDFGEMLSIYTLGSFASTANQQLEMLSKMGLNVQITGVDMNDVAKHPEKYAGKDIDADAKVTGQEEFKKKMQQMGKDAEKAKLDLATGKTQSTTEIAAKIDQMHGILLTNPEEYADPMNVIMQKMNYTVYQRKNLLYQGLLYSLNKKTYSQVSEIVKQCNRKITELSRQRDVEMEQYDKQRAAAEKQAQDGGYTFQEAEWNLRKHAIHQKFFAAFNNIEETGFGSATNVISVAYVQRIKPAVEGFYYDVFRHVALISDPEVRDQKDVDLRNDIYAALTWSLNTVLLAHGSFSYSDDWDCDCNLEELLAAREAEEKAMEEEENARIARNQAAKARFDSGEIPESSPLFKKLDSYVDTYNFGLVRVRASCARTVVEANTDFLPNDLPFNFHYKSVESENTGAITRSGGIGVGAEKEISGGKVTANLNMDVTVSSDGNGVIRDYSVTGSANVGVKVGNYNASVGATGTASNTGYSTTVSGNASTNVGNSSAGVNVKFTNTNGETNYTVGGNLNTSVKYGSTKVSGGAAISYDGNKGFDSDFSAGLSSDMKNEFGGTASFKTEASTKRGCSVSGKVDQTINAAGQQVTESAVKNLKEKSGLEANVDFWKRELWSGKYEFKKKEDKKTE